MDIRMHDLDNAYREGFVDAWTNGSGVEPHEAGLVNVFLLGADVHGSDRDALAASVSGLAVSPA